MVQSSASHRNNYKEDDDRSPSANELIKDDDLPGTADYTAFQKLLASNPDWEEKAAGNEINDSNLATAASLAEYFDQGSGLHDDFFAEAIEPPWKRDVVTFLRSNRIVGPRPTTRRLGQQQYRWDPGSQVKADWEAKHKAYGYRATAPDKEHNLGPVVTLCYMTLAFPKGMEFGEKYLNIHPEFSAPGQRNPNVYATLAPDGDPAMRLAIRAHGLLKSGEEFDMYMHRDTQLAVEAANSFADRVLEGINTTDLGRRLRRFVPKQRQR